MKWVFAQRKLGTTQSFRRVEGNRTTPYPTITVASQPYRRLPQFDFNYGREVAGTGLQFQTSAQIARFDSSHNPAGERLNLRPRLYYPFKDAAGYVTPSLTLQHTQYWLHNLSPGQSSTFTRTAPIFSVDSGSFFEREFELGGASMQQTLEPRLFYLFVPKVNQPYDYTFAGINQGLNFDTSEYDFNFYQLFRDNRFAGYDSLTDANQLTPALTTRLIDRDSGLERLRLSVGKIFYFKTPQVVLYTNQAEPTFKSNLVGELYSKLSENWTFTSTGQWNPSYNRLDRGQISLQYNNFANNLINLSYRYRRDPFEGSIPPVADNPLFPRNINQTDVNFRLPLATGWFAIGQWQYSLLNQVTTQAMAGIEHETCCWRFSLIGLRYLNGVVTEPVTSSPVSTNNAVFFQVELKGLGRFGDDINQFLSQTLSGFRTDYDSPGMYHP